MANMDRISTMLDPASLTALAAMNHLVPIANDEQQAWENIEMIADAIDIVVALVENNQMSDETGKAATVDYLLKMLTSPCEEVVKLALSGLDRIVFKNEVAVYAVRIGAFDYLANLITRSEDGQYQKLKSSDVLAFLMAPPENKYLKTSALNHKIFEEHLRMVLHGNEKAKERGLQFLWCITHNCKEAQEKVITRSELFPVILQAIADADCGRNALRLLHNLSKSDSAKKKLPVKEISSLVKPIMNIPDHIISKKDKAITALTVANLLEGGNAVDPIIVEYLRDMVYELVQASFYSSKFTLMEVVTCFNTLASKEENKLILANSRLIKTLIDMIKLKDAPEKVIGKGYTLLSVKETAAKTLWYLAYNEAIQKKMREDGGGLAELKVLHNEIKEEKLKKNVKDVLWIFELKDANQKMTDLKYSAGNMSRTALTTSPSTPARALSPSPSLAPSKSPEPPKSYTSTPSTPSHKPTTPSAPLSTSPTSTSATPSSKPSTPTSAPSTSPTATSATPSVKPSTPSTSSSPSSASSSSTPSYKPPTPSTSSTTTTSNPPYKPPTPATSSSSPSHKSPTPSTPSTTSTPSSKPPISSTSSTPSTPSASSTSSTPSASSTSSTPSYKPPTTSTAKPSTTSPTPSSSTFTPKSKVPDLQLDIPSTSSTSSSRSPTSPAPSPSPTSPVPSSSPSPSPSPVPSRSPVPSPSPSPVPPPATVQPATTTPQSATTKPQPATTTPQPGITTKFTPSTVSNGPKYGRAAASASPTTTTTTPGERPKWMVGGARAAAAGTPTSPTTPPLSTPAAAASLSASDNKPKWFVSSAKK